MNLSFSDEQEELRRYVRGWLDERAPFDEVRRIMEGLGVDSEQWAELGELGWLGMAISEEHGGAGYGFLELAVMAEEMGRSLYPSPFMSTVVLAASLIRALGSDEQQAEMLGAIAGGRTRPAVAVGEGSASWVADGFATTASADDGDGWTVSGVKRFVIDGASADRLLVATDAGVFVVDPDGPGVDRVALDVMDPTRPLAEIIFDRAPGDLLGDGGGDVSSALGQVLDRAIAVLAMEQVGGAQACLDMSVAYAKQRHQFGRAIGSFQAIKHMCADMLVAVESARSAAYHLAWAIDHDPDEASVAAPLAKSYCSEAYFSAAADTIQIHGGIGFTWEHNAHLYLKRAKSSELLFGDPVRHRARLADRIGL